jgi:L-lactate utilization protein LutC
VQDIVRKKAARKVLIGEEPLVGDLGLLVPLILAGIDVIQAGSLTEDQARSKMFAADLAVTGVDCLIAETGSVAVLTEPKRPRSPSLLPPIHIVVAQSAQLIPDLFDMFDQGGLLGKSPLPSCVALITGPSKTGDIELRLVTGVHGPGELHVVIVDKGIPG